MLLSRIHSLIRSLACALSLTLLAACHNSPAPLETYQTEEFDLAAGPCAAEGYPMEVIEGRFMTSDGKSFPVPPIFLEGDWGLSATGMVGDATQPAPDSLELRWFSYPEDKFYEGRWALPQHRIHELLRQGYWDHRSQKHETYNQLTVCVLPKGAVVVWLAGQNQVLIGRYQGREINYPFERFQEGTNRERMLRQERAKLPVEVQVEIRTGNISTARWDAYMTTYPWKVEVSERTGSRVVPLTLYDQSVDYVNGEHARYPRSPQELPAFVQSIQEPTPKPVPKVFSLYVENEHQEKYELRIDSLNEQETMAAYQEVARRSNRPMTLHVEVDGVYKKATLTLRNDYHEVPLRKAVVEIYRED